MAYSRKNENKPNLEVRRNGENLKKVDPKKISRKKLLSNIPQKVKDVYKPSNQSEDESEVHYDEDYDVKKRKTKV